LHAPSHGDAGAVQLSEEEKTAILNAILSLDPHAPGFNLDDFMRTLQSMAAWNVKGRAANDVFRDEEQQAQNKKSQGFQMVNQMV